MNLTVFGLTAGLGTRLRPYTLEKAKPAIPFFGTPLLFHALRHVRGLHFDRLILNLHHCPETVQQLDVTQLGVPAPIFSHEEGLILGSGGAIAKAFGEIQTDHLLMFNGDEVFLPQHSDALAMAFEDHQQSGRLATLVTMDHPEVGHSLGGAWCDERGKVVRFAKNAQAGLVGHHYVGYLFLRKTISKYFPPDLCEKNILYDFLQQAIDEGQDVGCFSHKAAWFETGNVKSFLAATELLLTEVKNPQSSLIGRSDFVRFIQATTSPQFTVEQENPFLLSEMKNWLASLRSS